MLQCICNNTIIYIFAVDVIFLLLTFLSRVKIYSTNWRARNEWVFIAQMVEHAALTWRPCVRIPLN